jgi:hypothetical protein
MVSAFSVGMARSVVEYFSEHEGYRCGYCKSEDTNYSHGMWAHVLTVQDYQVGILMYSHYRIIV